MKTSARWGLFGGLAFLALGVVAATLILVDSPSMDASGRKILHYYEDRTTAITLATVLFGLASFAFAFFAGTFRIVLRAAEDESGLMSGVAMGAGLAGVAVLNASAAATWAAASRAGDGELTRNTAQTLFDLSSALYVFALPLIGVFMVASGAVVISSGMLPRWLGWTAVAIGITLAVPFVSWAMFALVPIWVAVVSAILLDRGERIVEREGYAT